MKEPGKIRVLKTLETGPEQAHSDNRARFWLPGTESWCYKPIRAGAATSWDSSGASSGSGS